MDLAVETPGIENDVITNSRRETEDGPENRTQKKSVADTLRERSEVDPVSGELVLGPSSATKTCMNSAELTSTLDFPLSEATGWPFLRSLPALNPT